MENKKEPFKWEIGRVYRAKGGELLQLLELTEKIGRFQMLGPKTKEPSPFTMEGPREGLDEMAAEMKLEPIQDLAAHKPTGLIMSPEDPRWQLH